MYKDSSEELTSISSAEGQATAAFGRERTEVGRDVVSDCL